MPAEAEGVALVTWTLNDAPGASDTAEQTRVWVGAVPVMEQPTGPEAMDQLMPGPPGKGSLKVTPVAVPVPAAAEFDTVMVKPMEGPADTGVASAVFVMDSPGAWTVNGSQVPTEVM